MVVLTPRGVSDDGVTFLERPCKGREPRRLHTVMEEGYANREMRLIDWFDLFRGLIERLNE